MNYYLIHIQYLGFRFHGWQRQPGVKTVEAMVCKTLEFVLGHSEFKVLGTSRTDAMVSAGHSAFELFVEDLLDPDAFPDELNHNLPPDIRALEMEAVGKEFNILNSPRTKEYLYFFSCGEKFHPFCAPFMAWIPGELDIPLMSEGAALFAGKHNFIRYCTKPSPGTDYKREIIQSRIEENTAFSAGFFPGQSWVYRVSATGFMRHQVRLMMGQLIALGRREASLEDLRDSLSGIDRSPLKSIAPASGLMLNKVRFHDR
ncbi:MAG: tRNA pseudouridine(38-40) synthase TruA [Desulfobacter sp.]|nr:MAG: tRNA pseudouridine(38-40) synthase TruA [Desulfobacter sp.]